MKTMTVALCAALALSFLGSAVLQAQDTQAQVTREHQNIQALPADISDDELSDVMLGFLRALGLPRRAGQGCLHCHEGDLEVPRREWDFASDAKPTKSTARQMIRMVRAINSEHLSGLQHRNAPDFEVGCVTCHEGRVDPRPLPLLLQAAEEAGGVDSVTAVYRAIHNRFYGAAAYDLRVRVLASLAQEKAEQGDFEDAIKLSTLNEETHEGDASARRVTLRLHVLQALDTEGPAAAVAVFDEMMGVESAAVLAYSVLDGVGWRTFRLDRWDEAMVLFRRNREAFPDLYFTFESLVEAQQATGEITQDEIIRQYEEFLEANPGHAMAERQLTNHRRR
jgi:hypothetical protein